MLQVIYQFLPSELEAFIQIQEEAFPSKSPKGIVQRQIGTGGFVEQYPESGAIARLKDLE